MFVNFKLDNYMFLRIGVQKVKNLIKKYVRYGIISK